VVGCFELIMNLKNKKYGNLTIIEEVSKKHYKCGKSHRMVKCRCKCGAIIIVGLSAIKSGNTKSCGCYRKENPNGKTHGMRESPEYRIWCAMRNRCYNKNVNDYEYYGGRGISVCKRWQEKGTGFINFFADIGKRPSSTHSIDRIDNNGNYEPTNCKWSTAIEQASNKRNNIKYLGETASQASRRLGGKDSLVSGRVRKGWGIKKSFTTPILRY
jgi:hypothetical protein